MSAHAGPPPGAWLALTRAEARMVARDTAGLVLPIGLPPLIMIMNGAAGTTEPVPALGGLSAMDAVVVPSTLIMIVAMLGVINVPSFLASYRQHGILRRLSTTPARPSMVLVAQVAVNLALAIVGMAMAMVLAVVAYNIEGPRSLGWTAFSLALSTAALYATGLLVAAIARTANAALAIGLVGFFVMMAAGGGMMPAEMLPDFIARIGELLPYGAALHSMRDGWVGDTPSLAHVAVLVAAIVIGPLAAARVFRWQ